MERIKEIILSTPTFPYLWLPHCTAMCLGLRAALGENYWKSFSRRHPLSCFLLGLLYIYPGGIMASFVLGEPLLSFLTAPLPLYGAFVSLYLSFYCPGDAFIRMIKSTRLLPVLAAAQDWQRTGLVLAGLQTINERHPDAFLYPVVFAVIKSSGFMIVKFVENAILNGWKGAFFIPNQASKTMVVSAVVMQIQFLYHPLAVSDTDLYCYLVMYAVVMRLLTSLIAQADWDPYAGLENQICGLLYGVDSDDSSTEDTGMKDDKEMEAKKQK